jgi:hypothetical protein
LRLQDLRRVRRHSPVAAAGSEASAALSTLELVETL